jgi:hypothetical protein
VTRATISVACRTLPSLTGERSSPGFPDVCSAEGAAAGPVTRGNGEPAALAAAVGQEQSDAYRCRSETPARTRAGPEQGVLSPAKPAFQGTMRFTRSVVTAVAAGLFLAIGSPASAQDGFALKLGGVFNSSTVEERETELRLHDAAGWNLGLEYVLPNGLGLGVSGYTSGSPNDFDTSEGSLVVLADVNYFFRLPLLPVAPYAGLHVGLGTYRMQDVQDGVRPSVDFGDRGWQFGVRFQPTSLIGVDAQFRNVSGSLAGAQESSFETRQLVLGVTLF